MSLNTKIDLSISSDWKTITITDTTGSGIAGYGSNYNVDIIWHTEEPKEFVEFQVWPSEIGQHIIGGWESAYEAARKVALNIVDEPILKE